MNQNFIQKVITRNLRQLYKTRQHVITPDQIPEIYPQRPSINQALTNQSPEENGKVIYEINRSVASPKEFDHNHLEKNSTAAGTEQQITENKESVGPRSDEQYRTSKKNTQTIKRDLAKKEDAQVRPENYVAKNTQKKAIIPPIRDEKNKVNMKTDTKLKDDIIESTSAHVSDKKEIRTIEKGQGAEIPVKIFTSPKITEKNNITEENTYVKENGSNEIKEVIQYIEEPIPKNTEENNIIEPVTENVQPDSEFKTEKIMEENTMYEPPKYTQFNYFITQRKQESDAYLKVESEPVINIRIGKIEVNVIKPSEAASEEGTKPSLSLDKYLEERERGVR
jgi:hypothetical protein